MASVNPITTTHSSHVWREIPGKLSTILSKTVPCFVFGPKRRRREGRVGVPKKKRTAAKRQHRGGKQRAAKTWKHRMIGRSTAGTRWRTASLRRKSLRPQENRFDHCVDRVHYLSWRTCFDKNKILAFESRSGSGPHLEATESARSLSGSSPRHQLKDLNPKTFISNPSWTRTWPWDHWISPAIMWTESMAST